MKISRDFMRFYSIPIALFIGVLLTAAFTLFYTMTARTQDGKLVGSNWPKEFTLAFSQYITDAGGRPAITEVGKARLDEYGLWLQILDEAGAEVLNYAKPDTVPGSYQPYELLQSYQYGDGQYSVFVSQVATGNMTCTYLIGFPFSISKVVMYIDNARYNSGKALILATIALTAILVITLTVYSCKTFVNAEKQRKLDDKAREEWLVNITHDLKTPLAPIRGYAELLSDGSGQPEAGRYGQIILKNVLYAQQLVDDLKLTYQLQSNMLPLKTEPQNVTCFVKEVVIDILNTPEYEGRVISFDSDCQNLPCRFDSQLFRRALTNIIVNALKHNAPDTRIAVSIKSNAEIKICVADNGCGMTAQEVDNLFKRYYRGTSTEIRTEGSGLGMAIAKQVIEAHGGKIFAESAVGAGTTITICLPQKLKV